MLNDKSLKILSSDSQQVISEKKKEKKREKDCIYYSAFYLEIIKFKGSETTLTLLQDVLHTRK